VAIVDSRTSPMLAVADYAFVTPTESVSFFQSMTGPLAMFNAIIAEIASIGEEQLGAEMDTAGRIYERLGVVWHDANPSLRTISNHSPDFSRSLPSNGVEAMKGDSRGSG
jgi:hypothetical protein